MVVRLVRKCSEHLVGSEWLLEIMINYKNEWKVQLTSPYCKLVPAQLQIVLHFPPPMFSFSKSILFCKRDAAAAITVIISTLGYKTIAAIEQDLGQ